MAEKVKIIGNYFKDGVINHNTTLVLSNIVERLQTEVKIDIHNLPNEDIIFIRDIKTNKSDELFTKVYLVDECDNVFNLYLKGTMAYVTNDDGKTIDSIKSVE